MLDSIINPPAIVREAFDEQALKREWNDACADEQDAVTRKQAVLRKALARWPMVPRLHRASGRPMKQLIHSLEMRRFVRDVLRLPDAVDGSMNSHARKLLIEGRRERALAQTNAYGARNRRIKSAVVELVTKYRLGADAHECMEALAKFYEEQTNAQA